jgi:hypothetical protein
LFSAVHNEIPGLFSEKVNKTNIMALTNIKTKHSALPDLTEKSCQKYNSISAKYSNILRFDSVHLEFEKSADA